MLTECICGGSQEGRPGFIIKFDYDVNIVEDLKYAIPHTEREWREEEKRWWISDDFAHVLEGLFKNFHALAYDQMRMF